MPSGNAGKAGGSIADSTTDQSSTISSSSDVDAAPSDYSINMIQTEQAEAEAAANAAAMKLRRPRTQRPHSRLGLSVDSQDLGGAFRMPVSSSQSAEPNDTPPSWLGSLFSQLNQPVMAERPRSPSQMSRQLSVGSESFPGRLNRTISASEMSTLSQTDSQKRRTQRVVSMFGVSVDSQDSRSAIDNMPVVSQESEPRALNRESSWLGSLSNQFNQPFVVERPRSRSQISRQPSEASEAFPDRMGETVSASSAPQTNSQKRRTQRVVSMFGVSIDSQDSRSAIDNMPVVSQESEPRALNRESSWLGSLSNQFNQPFVVERPRSRSQISRQPSEASQGQPFETAEASIAEPQTEPRQRKTRRVVSMFGVSVDSQDPGSAVSKPVGVSPATPTQEDGDSWSTFFIPWLFAQEHSQQISSSLQSSAHLALEGQEGQNERQASVETPLTSSALLPVPAAVVAPRWSAAMQPVGGNGVKAASRKGVTTKRPLELRELKRP